MSHCGENFVFYVGYIVGVVYYVVYTLYLGKNPIVNLRLEIRKLLLLTKVKSKSAEFAKHRFQLLLEFNRTTNCDSKGGGIIFNNNEVICNNDKIPLSSEYASH